MLTFDMDADSSWISRGLDEPIARSSGQFEVNVGVPNILELMNWFGLKTTFFTPGWIAEQFVDEMFVPDQLLEVLPRADFVLVTAPLTSETRGMVARKELDLMKPEVGLVNMARAGVVDHEALAEKLTRGELGGAILDVFDPEPLPPESPLWGTPNLIITPHVSSDDAEQYTPRMLDLFFENMGCYLSGRPLQNRVEATREY